MRYGVAKTYRATVDGFVDDKLLRSLEGGGAATSRPVPPAAGATRRRARIRIVRRSAERTTLEITVQEATTRDGRNRSVRQMLAHMGHKVRELCRIRFGPLELGGMPAGAWRLLSRDEIRKLRSSGEMQINRQEHQDAKEKNTPRRNR